jgi:hypothetical protein
LNLKNVGTAAGYGLVTAAAAVTAGGSIATHDGGCGLCRDRKK